MAIDRCDLCDEACVKWSIGNNAQQELWRTLVAQALCAIRDNTGAGAGNIAVSSCLEVTTAGAWGSIGDRITETRFYDSTPALVGTIYFNEDTQAVVTGITSGNTQPCPGSDIGESCTNPAFVNICDVTTPANLGLYAEDVASASGDRGSVVLIKRTDTAASQTTTDGDYTVPVANSFGVPYVNIDSRWQTNQANGLLKLEDSAHVTGDAGVFVFGLSNRSQAQISNNDLDYTPFATGLDGSVYIQVNRLNQTDTANSLLKAEDAAHSSGDAGVAVLGVRNETALVSSDTQGDYTALATNRYGAVCAVLDLTLINSAVIGTQPVRAEDSAFADTNAVMMAGAVNNETQATQFNTTNGDVTPIAVDRYGSQFCIPVSNGATAATLLLSPVRAEDSVIADGQALMMAGAVNNGGGSVQFNTTDGDVTPNAVTSRGIGLSNRGTSTRIATATTTTAKSGGGWFHRLIVNTAVAGATITIYDNTTGSGTIIALVTLPAVVGNPFYLEYGLRFGTGLTVVTSGATDITTVVD